MNSDSPNTADIVERPRDDSGRFLPTLCTDPNCGGETVRDTRSTPWGPEPVWRCDGLTHLADDGPLIACPREHAALKDHRKDQA